MEICGSNAADSSAEVGDFVGRRDVLVVDTMSALIDDRNARENVVSTIDPTTNIFAVDGYHFRWLRRVGMSKKDHIW